MQLKMQGDPCISLASTMCVCYFLCAPFRARCPFRARQCITARFGYHFHIGFSVNCATHCHGYHNHDNYCVCLPKVCTNLIGLWKCAIVMIVHPIIFILYPNNVQRRERLKKIMRLSKLKIITWYCSVLVSPA